MLTVSDSSSRRAARRGVSSIYIVVALVALCGFVSFGVDYGRVQLSKSQLQAAADAAARAGAAKLSDGATAARDAAVAVAAANTCNGDAVALISASDITLGTWDSTNKTFTAVSGAAENSATAIRVVARRLASRSTAIPLTFAKLVGKETFDIEATAIARGATVSKQYGIVGIGSITLDGNILVDSYNSGSGAYSTAHTPDKGHIGTNGNISFNSNVVVRGDANPGPSGSISNNGGTVTGSTTKLTSSMSYPNVNPSPYGTSNNNNTNLPAANRPGGSFSMSGGTVNMPAGVYYFSNFTMTNSSVLNVTGAAVVYVTGTLLIDGDARTSSHPPTNLQIKVVGSGNVSLIGNNGVWADIYAPQSNVLIDSNKHLYGRVIASTVTVKSNSQVHFDEALPALGSGGPSSGIALVD